MYKKILTVTTAASDDGHDSYDSHDSHDGRKNGCYRTALFVVVLYRDSNI